MISTRRPVLFLALALIAASHFYQVYSCDGHGHGDHGHAHHHHHEEPMEANPAFKYSKQANEAHQKAQAAHGHSHGGNDHGHAHGGHGHSHGAHDHGHGHSHGAHDHGHSHEHVQTHSQIKRQVKEEPVKTPASNSGFEKLGIALLSTLLISIAPFLVLFIIPLSNNSEESQPLLKVFLAFASGSLLGDAFLHLIPHALNPHDHHSGEHSHAHSHDEHGHDHSAQTQVGLWVLAGIITFLIVEKALVSIKGGHGHTHSHAPAKPAEKKKEKQSDDEAEESDSKKGKGKKEAKPAAKKEEPAAKSCAPKEDEINVSGYLNLAADFAHNFTDGLAIGASYLAGQNIGYITTLTILFHEVPHEIGDFAILIRSGCSRTKATMLQLLTAVGALSGTAVSILFDKAMSGVATSCILPFTAGGFIYIAAVSILPELKEKSSLGQTIKELIALCVGILMMVIIAYFE